MKNEDEIYEGTSDIQYVRTPRFRRLYERLSKDDRIHLEVLLPHVWLHILKVV